MRAKTYKVDCGKALFVIYDIKIFVFSLFSHLIFLSIIPLSDFLLMINDVIFLGLRREPLDKC